MLYSSSSPLPTSKTTLSRLQLYAMAKSYPAFLMQIKDYKRETGSCYNHWASTFFAILSAKIPRPHPNSAREVCSDHSAVCVQWAALL